MPELPEVRVVTKALKSKILNKTIDKVEVLQSKLIKEATVDEFSNFIVNETILDIFNIAKHIIIQLSNNKILITHLRMEGKYRFFESPSEKHKHTRLVYYFNDNSELHYLDSRMFGTIHLRTNNNYLNTKPLNKVAFTPDKVNVNKLYLKTSKSNVAIKTLILNQELVSGIGNIYADETLFASKVFPLKEASKISKTKLKEILTNAYLIMEKSFELGGSTIDSYESLNKQEGQFQNFLQVHTRVNKPCNICSTLIKKIKVNGRGTYYCPNCQKENKKR
ncbi:DNA-formamidopyrimidine glycosylase [Mycoplasma miroungirhinis]|uniref:DNA-formamidopyrimidine glycosylase n=1 Tax=Mycoplasma miroungirhinis TaxID=754516 RepID=A0A6M4JHC1_9MOLU|nr:DNA-formamidopyrimidine glycosylase [Mycoplasma miroungirhinis]QJR44422.1 DNA-formamidopyrimidine glycosylase [Mycoplasma miroungirhinis]